MLIKGGQGVRGEGTTEANKQAAHDSRPPESERKENGGRPDCSRGFALKQGLSPLNYHDGLILIINYETV